MLADPQSVTVSGSAKTLNRTGSGNDQGSFKTSDGAYVLTTSHIYGKRSRRLIKLQFNSIVASPLISGQNINQQASVHLVVDHPNGYDATVMKALADGFLAYLSASSGAVVQKLIGGES